MFPAKRHPIWLWASFWGIAFVPLTAAARPPEEAAIVDSLGRRVRVPARVERIISLEPEVSRIIVALGCGDLLVGVDFFLKNYDPLFPALYPPALDLPVISNLGQDLNFERAIQLRPDIIFSSPSEFGMTQAIERKLRVPVAALASLGRFDGLLGEIETVGRILDRRERAGELVAFFRKRVASIAPVDAADRRRPRIYLSFWGSLDRTPVFYDPVSSAGGANLAEGLLPAYLGAAGTTVRMEQLLLWNPDIILIQGNYLPAERQVTVEGVLSDPRLSSLRAVRERRVHYTFGFWYWWDPALVLVETLYLARLFDPGRFPGFDLIREGDGIFEFFYGRKAAFSALAGLLNCHEWIQN